MQHSAAQHASMQPLHAPPQNLSSWPLWMIAHSANSTVTNLTLNPRLVAELRDPTRMPRQETTNEEGSCKSVSTPKGLQAGMQVKSSQVAPGGSTFKYSVTLVWSLKGASPAATLGTCNRVDRGGCLLH